MTWVSSGFGDHPYNFIILTLVGSCPMKPTLAIIRKLCISLITLLPNGCNKSTLRRVLLYDVVTVTGVWKNCITELLNQDF
jgi:hypothetical protein